MRILVFRHAEKMGAGDNPPLTPYGEEQARMILELVQQNQISKPTKLIVSPKTRAVQTFMPLSKSLDLKIQISDELNMQKRNESGVDFAERVQRLLRQVQAGGGTVFICTHADWIEQALRAIECDNDLSAAHYQNWGPAQFMDFDAQSPTWSLNAFGTVRIR
jgi:broad specificity phosphatase PhoE